MNKTDIHNFTANITDKFEQFQNCSIEISGYTIFGKPSEDLRKNWSWIGWKVFITELYINISENFDTDEYYDEITDTVEKYLSESYYVGFRESQLPITTDYKKVENFDFDYEDSLEDEEDTDELIQKYKLEKWFNPDIEIYEEKLSYVYFRMYHLFGRWFDEQ